MSPLSAEYCRLIDRSSAKYGVPARLVRAIIMVESGGDRHATAAAMGDKRRGGSYGLMQISLDTARALGYSGEAIGLYNAAINIDLGTQYLRDLLVQTDGVEDAAVSGYNAGLSTVRPDDGKRTGNTNTAADRLTPFVNQYYVDSVLKFMAEDRSASH